MVSEQLSASIRSLYGPGSEMGAGTWDNRGQIRWAVTQAQGGLVPAAECWSHGGINLFWTCFNFHQIHLTMAQRAAENVQWSNRKPGLLILLLSLQLFLPCRLWWWVVYINSSHLLFFHSPLCYPELARLWVNIIANLVSGLKGGWRLWGADTGRADTDWHWPAKNWRSKIQENLNPTHSKWFKILLKR